MARPVDPAIQEILKSCRLDPKTVLWDCHGTWCMYHRAIEKVAADLLIEFEPPLVLEANGAGKSVALCVTGKYGSKREWSIGEAAPGNNKNAYPYAMAEKRAKDRVVLKLIGLHGLVYSEDEVDDDPPAREKEPAPPPKREPPAVSTVSNETKVQKIKERLQQCVDEGEIDSYVLSIKPLLNGLSESDYQTIVNFTKQLRESFRKVA